jgi:hypothetical protein
MARIRRLAVLAGAAALTGAFVAGPAQADAPEVFSGSAAGTVLDLSVRGTQATFGSSEATVNSAGVARSKASGMVLPVSVSAGGTTTGGTTVPAVTVGGAVSERSAEAPPGERVVRDRACATPAELEDVAELLGLGLVCGSARADNTDEPSASAEGSIAELEVSVTQVVSKVEEVLAQNGQALPIGDTLAGLLGEVCEAAGAGGAEGRPAEDAVCDATTTVKELVETVLKTQVVDVELGKSTSSVSAGSSSVTSEATAAGGTIKILPSPQVDGLVATEPLVTISVADGRAKTVYNRGEGAATAEVDPAIVRIKLNQGLIDQLPEKVTIPDQPDPQNPTKPRTRDVEVRGALEDEIIVGPQTLANLMTVFDALDAAGVEKPVDWCDQTVKDSVCILPGTPLESRVWFAGARTQVNPDGSAEAEANAVRVELLVGTAARLPAGTATAASLLTDPAVHLALAHAEAAVGGREAQTTPPTTACTDGQPGCEKDRSGGGGGDSGGPGDHEPPLELPRTGLPFVPMLGAAGLSLGVLFRRALVKASR